MVWRDRSSAGDPGKSVRTRGTSGSGQPPRLVGAGGQSALDSAGAFAAGSHAVSDRAAAAAAIALDSTPAPRPVRHEALGAQVFRGSWISLVAQATQLAFRLVSTIVLARLLTPDAYGLVAMVTVVTGFIGLFKSLGLATATVQAPRRAHARLNGLLGVHLAFGA